MVGNPDEREVRQERIAGPVGGAGAGEARIEPAGGSLAAGDSLKLGQVLDNRYFVTSALTSCDLWRAYRVVDLDSRQELVAQVLEPRVVCAPEKMAAIRAVAERAARGRHENIANIVAWSQSRSQNYILFEFSNGETLAETINRCERDAPISIAHAVAQQVLSGLDWMHKNGFVHGELSPRNVEIGADGGAKLSDAYAHELFCAATGGRPVCGLARTEDMWHRAPEQLRAESTCDAQMDVYLAGMLFGYMWTGTHPIAGATAQDIVKWHIDTEHEIGQSIAPALAKVLAKALAVHKPSRWADCGEFAKALADIDESSYRMAHGDSTAWRDAACRICGLSWQGGAWKCGSCGARRNERATIDEEPVVFVNAVLKRIAQDVERDIKSQKDRVGVRGPFGSIDTRSSRRLNAWLAGVISTVGAKYSSVEPAAVRQADFVGNLRCPRGNGALIALCELAFAGGPEQWNFFREGPNAMRLAFLWRSKALEFYDELQVRSRDDRSLKRFLATYRIRAALLRRKMRA